MTAQPTGAALLLASFMTMASASACEGGRSERIASRPTGGDADRGQEAILVYGCGACHVIPGVRAARGDVGPPLTGFGRRTFIAGLLPNTPDNLIRWIIGPRAIQPRTAMPELGLTEREARDIAAYLYALD